MSKKTMFSMGVGTTLAVCLLALMPQAAVYAETPAAQPPPRLDPARTEGAITGGLRWLAEHQLREGSQKGAWEVNIANYRPAIASLAGLAFLANGYLPGDKSPYGTNVAAALKYVTGTMAPDGYVGQNDKSGMYIHAISTLFALSCFGMQADNKDNKMEPGLADWCRRSIEVVVRAQQISKAAEQQGGWRYDPYTPDSDVSVTCWQLLVLHSARQAGYKIEPSVFSSALGYLGRAYSVVPGEGQSKVKPDYGYFYPDRRTGGQAERSSTALVFFIMSLFGVSDEQRASESLTYLRRYPPTWGGPQYGGFFYFGSFYMAQGMFQVGDQEWNDFGPRLATVLLDHQSGDGSWPYPPDNASPATMGGTGPAYPVAMAVLMLSLDKQYLPMYQRQRRLYDGGGVLMPPASKANDKTTDKTTDKTVDLVPTSDDGGTSTPSEAAAPVDSSGGGVEIEGPGAVEADDEGEVVRPIGSPMFK